MKLNEKLYHRKKLLVKYDVKTILGCLAISIALMSFSLIPAEKHCWWEWASGPWPYQETVDGACYYYLHYEGDLTGCNNQQSGSCKNSSCNIGEDGCTAGWFVIEE